MGAGAAGPGAGPPGGGVGPAGRGPRRPGPPPDPGRVLRAGSGRGGDPDRRVRSGRGRLRALHFVGGRRPGRLGRRGRAPVPRPAGTFVAGGEPALRGGGRRARLQRPPVEAARTHLAFGERLRRERRKNEARTQLRAAAEIFDRLDARPWADRARAELRAAGATAPSDAAVPASAVSALSPQELQIVRLVAAGLTNREIGAQLFLSPKTVSYHLYRAFPKLNVASRTQLARLDLTGRGPGPGGDPALLVARVARRGATSGWRRRRIPTSAGRRRRSGSSRRCPRTCWPGG